MSDNKNVNNESQPFSQKPFSVDVWERAYQNVGRPFAKKPFETAPEDDAKKSAPSNGYSSIKLERPAQSKSNTKPARPASKPTITVTPSSRLQTPVDSAYSQKSYEQKPEASSTRTYITDSAEEPKGIVQMLENGLDGSLSDIIGQIKEAIGIKTGEKKALPGSIMWFIIAIIFMIIMSALGN